MKKELLGLVKLGSREHMEDFRINGTMYMNTVEYFRVLEGRGHVGDEDEALQSCYQSDRVSVKITKPDGESILLTKENGLTGQILTRNNAVNGQNIFCMHAFLYSDMKPIVDERNLIFGDTYVCITNGLAFLERIHAAAKKAKVKIYRGLVEYVPRDSHNGKFGIFRKFDTHSYQNEYRFVLSPGLCMPYTLALGDISDITIIGSSVEINDHIEVVELPPDDIE